MSVYVTIVLIVLTTALCYWFMSRYQPADEPTEDAPDRGEEKYGGVLPFAATCVAVVLIVIAVCSV